MTACSATYTFPTDRAGTTSFWVRAEPHDIHWDKHGREWRSSSALRTPIRGLHLPTHSERYGRVLIEACETAASDVWVVLVADAVMPDCVLACVPDLTEFEAGRKFQRMVDHWRPIGLEQAREALR